MNPQDHQNPYAPPADVASIRSDRRRAFRWMAAGLAIANTYQALVLWFTLELPPTVILNVKGVLRRDLQITMSLACCVGVFLSLMGWLLANNNSKRARFTATTSMTLAGFFFLTSFLVI